MKKALKVTFGTMLAAALVSTTFAGESEFLARSAVWVTGTYTESSNTGTSYGDLLQFPGAGGFDGVHRHVFVEPDMDFDYALGYSYHIPCSHTRLFASYDHYNDTNESTNANIRNLGFSPAPATAAYGSVNNHAQEFRLGLSHALRFGRQLNVDLSGFFEWDEVKRDMVERNIQAATVRSRNSFESSKGWGPGVGGRVRAIPFTCYENWGVFAGTNTALLWAENTYESTLFESATLLYDYDPESTEAMIGKIDISFGINYSKRMRDLSCSVIDVALGLRYMNMFNVFKNGGAYANPVYPGSNGISYSANLGSAQDWGRVGPFLTFAIGGAGA